MSDSDNKNAKILKDWSAAAREFTSGEIGFLKFVKATIKAADALDKSAEDFTGSSLESIKLALRVAQQAVEITGRDLPQTQKDIAVGNALLFHKPIKNPENTANKPKPTFTDKLMDVITGGIAHNDELNYSESSRLAAKALKNSKDLPKAIKAKINMIRKEPGLRTLEL